MSGIVVLAQDRASSHIVINAIAQRFGAPTVVFEEPEGRGLFLKRRIKRIGVFAVADQLAFTAWTRLTQRFAARRIARIKAEHRLDDTPPASVHRVSSANADETIALLRRLAPRVVVVNGTRILSRRLLEAIDAPFINMHAGITPSYRGVHGGYWALAERDAENCGVTVHLVDPGIDTGDVLYQARITPTGQDSFLTYPYLQLAAGIPLLLRAVQEAMEGRLAPHAGQGASGLWTHPGLSGYLWRRLARGVK